MGKKFTFFVLSNSGAPVKQATVSKAWLSFFCIMLFFVTVASGFLCVDYYSLKFTSKNPRLLEKKINESEIEIEAQRAQLKRYASKINTLKAELISLNEFETKLRVIANIEKSDLQNSLFGVGGAIPEDLDVNILSSEKHNSLLREMNDQVEQIDQAIDNQEEGFADLYEYIGEQKNLLASTPAVSPTDGWVSSSFGYRTSPFTGRKSFHKGLDIANRNGTPIIATADGVVTFAGNRGNIGILLVVDHGHGMVTRFGHLQKIVKKPGESVKRGEIVAYMGNTGRSTGPHVHYEVRLNGLPVNPAKYILD